MMNPRTPAEELNWYFSLWWGWYVGTVNAMHRNYKITWRIK